MEKRINVIFAILLIFLFTTQSTLAQVTIGLGEGPEKGNIADDGENAFRGLGLPRVTLSKKDQLYPMFLSDPENLLSNPNDDYNDLTKKEA